MGGAIDFLEELVKLPFGCGEQNMILMAPSIFVRKYMETLDQVDKDLVKRTTRVMLNGIS